MLQIMESFLTNRQQRVTINGLNSEWPNIAASVPQGSGLGPVLFLVYINDLSEVIDSEVRSFVDDSFIFQIVSDDVQLTTTGLEQDLRKITKWANQWRMEFNPDI